MLTDLLVLIKGAGDMASGVAWRLHRAGFPIVMTELAQPLAVRRAVCFAEAIFIGETTVEGVVARRVPDVAAARALLAQGMIPMPVDPVARCREELAPAVLVDGIMAKANTGTRLADAPLVIALGPGFTAGVDCHVVIETNRGHALGRALWHGSAQPDTKTPGEIGGYPAELGFSATRVLRAPAAGHVIPRHAIGDRIAQGEVIAEVGGRPVFAPFAGVLRGLIHPAVPVTAGLKIGDLDPRAQVEHCFTISEKSLAVGGGVLEAILTARHEGRLR
ncbi:MAG: EF2563 family selenium-dependent molybdenum hydroxylase system protein [Anaerolineae bacterium]|nr:EF2563 family selenium-dependent molybdenum hydroxylase system protein [Anaerolineae bacterium]